MVDVDWERAVLWISHSKLHLLKKTTKRIKFEKDATGKKSLNRLWKVLKERENDSRILKQISLIPCEWDRYSFVCSLSMILFVGEISRKHSNAYWTYATHALPHTRLFRYNAYIVLDSVYWMILWPNPDSVFATILTIIIILQFYGHCYIENFHFVCNYDIQSRFYFHLISTYLPKNLSAERFYSDATSKMAMVDGLGRRARICWLNENLNLPEEEKQQQQISNQTDFQDGN